MEDSKITQLLAGTVHSELPGDFHQVILSADAATNTWLDITPLARNEWICLIISAKKPETRERRLKRALDQLSLGQRRPCCWEGCPHRVKAK